jgi:hypothetical protein
VNGHMTLYGLTSCSSLARPITRLSWQRIVADPEHMFPEKIKAMISLVGYH